MRIISGCKHIFKKKKTLISNNKKKIVERFLELGTCTENRENLLGKRNYAIR